MDFIEYTRKWFEGEIFEDYAMVGAGVVMLVLTFAVWRFGASDSARAIWIPMLLVALLHAAGGASLAINNHHRLAQFEKQYQEQPIEQFVQSEKARVDGFMGIYPMTIVVAAILFVAGTCMFAFCPALWHRGTALVLIYLALSGLVIDYFSKDRALVYLQEINKFIGA